MTTDEKIALLKSWMVTLEYYGRQGTSKEVIEAYCMDLEDLPIEAVLQAFVLYRRNPKNRAAPLPASIRELVRPDSVSDDNQAIEAVARIIEALGRFGSYNTQDAREYIGQLGWEVVLRQGGWFSLCSTVGDENPLGVFQAQAIKVARSVIEQSRAGTLGEAPELPKSLTARIASPPGLISVGQLIGGIGQQKSEIK